MTTEDQNGGYEVKGRADGWTPLIDTVVAELGTVAAVVYGVVHRHTKMRRGVCDASQPTMARLTGLGERTIRKWLRVLEDAGYIRDITDPPDKEGVPRTYVTTGKAADIEVFVSVGTPALDTGVPEPTPAPNAAPPAPNAGGPRHEMPPTPAPGAAKETIRKLNQETREETISSSSGENATPAPETPPEGEEGEGISPSLNDLTELGMQAGPAKRIIEAVGPERAAAWAEYVRARGDVQNLAGYLWRIFQKGDMENPPPALPPQTESEGWSRGLSGATRKENPPTEEKGWLVRCAKCRKEITGEDCCLTCLSCPDCCECDTLSPESRAAAEALTHGFQPAPTIGTCPSCGKAYRKLCPTCGRCTVGVGDREPCCTCGDTAEDTV